MILDWVMPGLSGIDVAKALRQDATTAQMPIIMVTGKGEDTDFAQASARGISAYLVKPFSPLALVEVVDTVLGPPSGKEP